MLDLSIGFTALRCNLETILGKTSVAILFSPINNQHNDNENVNVTVSSCPGVEKNGELMGEVESIEEKLWKVEI